MLVLVVLVSILILNIAELALRLQNVANLDWI